MKLRVFRYVAWGLVAGVLIAIGIVELTGRSAPPPSSSSTSVPMVGGPFTLVDQQGKQRSWEDFRGKATAVFFGLTHCPDICPTTLFELSERLKGLGPRGDDLNVVLISVDPERDTPEVLARYLQSFDKRIVALTGSDAKVEEAVRAFRAYRKKVPTSGDDYTMDHSAWSSSSTRAENSCLPSTGTKAPRCRSKS